MREQAGLVWREAGDSTALLRASIMLQRVSPLDWLAGVPDQLRFYGSTRDAEYPLEIGGVGVADEAMWTTAVDYDEVFTRLHRVLDASAHGLRYYGGFRFDQQQPVDDDWRDFGEARFVIPRFELVTHAAASQLSFHFTVREADEGLVEQACSQLETMSWTAWDWEAPLPPPQERVELPDWTGWQRNVEAALAEFDAGTLEKVVLARKAIFRFARRLDPITLLYRLKQATPECYHFCYMPSATQAFVGASPERLFRRDGALVQSEAVAGTRMRGATPEEDEAWGRELLNNPKDAHEHEVVRQSIRRALTPVCDDLQMDEAPSLLKLARGQHLYSAVQGELRTGVSDARLLAALHPTPALGGQPKDAALERIAEWEPFDRGWYAAPVGWVSRTSAEFAVAIRCGLVQPERLALFSGAGIVRGSTAASEWEEIELKIRDFINVLMGE
jgi:menaquinone-specific isochorismate synthase